MAVLEDRQIDRFDLPFPADRPVTGANLLSVLRPIYTQAARSMQLVQGTVSQLLSSPARVVITDATAATYRCRYAAAYTPTVGDNVACLVNGAGGVVLFRLA